MERDVIPVQGKLFMILLLLCVFFTFLNFQYFISYILNNTNIFRQRVILPSLTWHIKVLPVVIQREMQSPSEFFLMMDI